MTNWLNLGAALGDTLDKLFTSDEERQTLNNQLARIENQFNGQVLELQHALLTAQAKVVTAEAQGESALQRNWRPITMLTFLILIVLDSFGVLAFRLSEQAWGLLELGLGGYVIGRSVEKSLPAVGQILDKLKGK